MDSLNIKWLGGKENFYFRYKRRLLESMIEGSCLNVGCGSHIIQGATNVDEGLPNLSYPDNSFDTVICSDVLEHIGPHKQALAELLRIARKKVIVTVPAHRWLYGRYDRLLGHKRRYSIKEFSGFDITYLFWFLIPILMMRKFLNLRHRQLPALLDRLFFFLSKLRFGFGTTILAVKYKFLYEQVEKHKISVLIPIFNEEKIINRDVHAIDYIIRKLPFEYEIIIVNDASEDKTKMISEKITRTNKNVLLHNYSLGPTRRENLAKSFKKATGSIIVFVDGDLIASLRFLPDLINYIFIGYDIVTGSRYVPGAWLERKKSRLCISLLYNWLIRVFFRTDIRDHMCGFKAFKREAALRLVDEMGYDTSLRRGIFWDTELLVRALRYGYKVKEIPIWWRERNKSALSFRREIKTIPYILKFYRETNRRQAATKPRREV